MNPVFVTYYTPPYSVHAGPWEQSLRDQGHLTWHIQKIGDRGSWRLNCGYKHIFIKQMLETFKRPVVWLDVDARVLARPTLFADLIEKGYDFAAYFIPRKLMQPGDVPLGNHTSNDGIAAGTMLFNDTPASHALLAHWHARDIGQHYAEQFVLGEAWHLHNEDIELKTSRLPQSYCHIVNHKWRQGEEGPTVIEHLQASRQLKRKAGRRAHSQR